MTPEQWKNLKQKENATNSAKNYGAYGPQSFKSRSLQAFQKDLERGKANHLLPVFNAKEELKAGKIKAEDIPYMQRGKLLLLSLPFLQESTGSLELTYKPVNRRKVVLGTMPM